MAPNTTDRETTKEECSEEAVRFQTLLTEGKQAYVSNNLKDAEAKLSEAAELSVAVYGVFAPEAFDPHFYYGKTLIELAKMEDSVFSTALHGLAPTNGDVSSDEKDDGIGDMEALSEEERAEIAEKVGDALEENAKALEKKVANSELGSSGKQENGHEVNKAATEGSESAWNNDEGKEEAGFAEISDVDKEAGDAVVADKNGTEEKQVAKEEIVKDKEGKEECRKDDLEGAKNKGTNGGKKDEDESAGEEIKDETLESKKEEDGALDQQLQDEATEEEEDKGDAINDTADVEYLQLAWESLEVARTICDRHLDEEGWKEKKVEVLLELVDCATDDENYVQAIVDSDTCITLMKSIFEENDRRIAQAYFLKARAYSLSKDFQNAAKIFEKSKAVLQARLEELDAAATDGDEKVDVDKIKKEIADLKSLLPDIQAKIDDALESAKSLLERSIESDEKGVTSEAAVKGMPVDDVSGLVRKKAKRAAEDEPNEEAKRARSDNAQADNVQSVV